MFSIRKNIGENYHWDRKFFTTLHSDLSKAGYSNVTIKLPVNISAIVGSVKTDASVQELKKLLDSQSIQTELSFEGFLDRERNFNSVIFISKNENINETIKILFVNNPQKASFDDDTFPSAESVPSQLYVQSPDPARIHSLSEFLYSYLRSGGQPTSLHNFRGLFSTIFIAVEAISFISSGSGILNQVWNVGIMLDIVGTIVALITLYRFYTIPRGLSINERETATLGSYFRRILTGELRNNPVIVIFINIIVTVIATIVLKLVGFL